MVRLFLLCGIFFYGLPVAANPLNTTIVVRPWLDQTNDEESARAAAVLSEKLRQETSLVPIDAQKVDAVLQYYDGYRPSAETEPVSARAKDLLFQAKEDYFRFDYDIAEQKLNAVIKIFEQSPELRFGEGETLRDAWMTLGLLRAARKEKETTQQAFEEVLKIAPNYQLDERAFSPSIRREFAQARSRLFQQPVGTLRVEGEPKVAEVFLNGIYQGVSPLSLPSLPVGEYCLRFQANHYRTVDRLVTVRAEETNTVQHQLAWEEPAPVAEKIAPSFKEIQSKVAEGVRVADLLKVDKVLWVDVDGSRLETRLVDREYRTALQPIHLETSVDENSLSGLQLSEKRWSRLLSLLYAQSEVDLLKKRAALDPKGLGDPILLGRESGEGWKKAALYGGASAVGVGAILAGIFAKEGNDAPNGTLNVSFK